MIDMFAVMALKKEIRIDAVGVEYTLPLSWADGMIGALAVFETKTEAEDWAEGDPIVEIKYKDDD